MMDFQVESSSLDKALEVLAQLPEFDKLRPSAYYESTLSDKEHLILIARNEKLILGCKIGYDKFSDGSFYSWLGGVLPAYRKYGIAKKLAEFQQHWASKKGYKSIKFKTQNRHKAMLQFAIRNGFSIYNTIPKDSLEQYRIELVKYL